jgi:hypothetical protein
LCGIVLDILVLHTAQGSGRELMNLSAPSLYLSYEFTDAYEEQTRLKSMANKLEVY